MVKKNENYALHAVVVKKPVEMKEAQHLANKFIKGVNRHFVRETKGSYRFRNIPKQKFNKFKTKKINDKLSAIYGELKPENHHLKGSGMLDYFKAPVNYVSEKVGMIGKYFSPKLDGYNNKSTTTIKKYGNLPILSMQIFRTPLSSKVNMFLNALSFGKLNAIKKKYGFDDFFHLALVCNLGSKNIMCQKNSVVDITEAYKDKENTEVFNVDMMGKTFTINDMLSKTRSRLGDKAFFEYDMLSHNCQHFVANLLESEGIFNPDVKAFVYQNISEIIKEIPAFSKYLIRGTTDLDAIINKITGGTLPHQDLEGGGMEEQFDEFIKKQRRILGLGRKVGGGRNTMEKIGRIVGGSMNRGEYDNMLDNEAVGIVPNKNDLLNRTAHPINFPRNPAISNLVPYGLPPNPKHIMEGGVKRKREEDDEKERKRAKDAQEEKERKFHKYVDDKITGLLNDPEVHKAEKHIIKQYDAGNEAYSADYNMVVMFHNMVNGVFMHHPRSLRDREQYGNYTDPRIDLDLLNEYEGMINSLIYDLKNPDEDEEFEEEEFEGDEGQEGGNKGQFFMRALMASKNPKLNKDFKKINRKKFQNADGKHYFDIKEAKKVSGNAVARTFKDADDKKFHTHLIKKFGLNGKIKELRKLSGGSFHMPSIIEGGAKGNYDAINKIIKSLKKISSERELSPKEKEIGDMMKDMKKQMIKTKASVKSSNLSTAKTKTKFEKAEKEFRRKKNYRGLIPIPPALAEYNSGLYDSGRKKLTGEQLEKKRKYDRERLAKKKQKPKEEIKEEAKGENKEEANKQAFINKYENGVRSGMSYLDRKKPSFYEQPRTYTNGTDAEVMKALEELYVLHHKPDITDNDIGRWGVDNKIRLLNMYNTDRRTVLPQKDIIVYRKLKKFPESYTTFLKSLYFN